MSGDARVELAQSAGGGVAWVDEDAAVFAAGSGVVHGGETGAGHVDFATYLKARRQVIASQFQRDVADGAYVVGYIFAGDTVAAGGRAHQHAVDVQQTDGDPVDLGFTTVGWDSAFVCVQSL